MWGSLTFIFRVWGSLTFIFRVWGSLTFIFRVWGSLTFIFRCHRMGCPPLKLSPRTRGPRTSCPPGQLVLGPHVPLGQLVLGPCVPLRTSCPPVSERLQNSYIILCAILSNKFIVNLHKTALDYAWLARHTRYTAVYSLLPGLLFTERAWKMWSGNETNCSTGLLIRLQLEAQHGFSQTTNLVPRDLVWGRAWELP